ncbi:MAG TPA: acyl-CoA dehydrogenase family protein [Beijerinckiaceae bacterium]|jgi:3-hydroxy-9,10-secoandrosta-1,3,5(10)-triene-9,17-dione monooxygenase|nr:acyl-CoA dehydrogenase family protein [Beijerinckiaceae bacterium]
MGLIETVDSGAAITVTREMVLERAASLAPVLAARSAHCESLRRCPDETIDDYVNSGLLRICQPRRYGGYELGYDVLCEATETLAQGCGSQAWVHMVLADNPLKLSAFSLDAQDEVWGKDTTAKIGVAIAAVGKARRVEGGIRWTGRHGFSSGIDHADWVICGGNIYEDGKPIQGCFALIPTREVKIIDDWFAMGLAGSGSKSFEVDDVFVPDHRVLDKKAYDEGRSPGTLYYTAPVTKLPRGGVSAVSYTAVAVGVAAGFVENYYKFTGPRKSRGNPVADDVGIQIGAGIASAEVEAAQRMYLGAVRETMQVLERGEEVTPHMQVQGKRNAAYAAQLAMSAVQRLFNAAGGRALYTDNVLQRQFRDCYAASAHHSVVWDGAAAAYGRYQLKRHAG